jgi:hypothetical protein
MIPDQGGRLEGHRKHAQNETDPQIFDQYVRRNIVPSLTLQILERTLDAVTLRANSNGECFGGEIMDAMRQAGVALKANGLEILLTRTVVVQTMESLGESYPAMVLQDYENRMPASRALKYLTEAMNWTRRLKHCDGGLTNNEACAGSPGSFNAGLRCRPEKTPALSLHSVADVEG